MFYGDSAEEIKATESLSYTPFAIFIRRQRPENTIAEACPASFIRGNSCSELEKEEDARKQIP